MDIQQFDEAVNEVQNIIQRYEELENVEAPKMIPRLKPMI